MSKSIADVGRTLLGLLHEGLSDEAKARVRLLSPAEVAAVGGIQVALCLYAVVENAFLKGEDREIAVDASGLAQPGLFVKPALNADLYYMVTAYPFSALEEGDEPVFAAHEALARALRVLYENGIVPRHRLVGTSLDGVDLHLSLNPVTVEDMARIWSAFPDQPYRPSVCYVVTPVPIRSEIQVGGPPVVAREQRLGHLARGGRA